MKEKTKKWLCRHSLKFFALMIICMFGFFLYVVSITQPVILHKVVEGVVTNVDVVVYESDTIVYHKGEIKYLIVTFDNNETYKIRYKDDLDLTVHSKLIIELSYEKGDDLYFIEQIIKVPK